MTEQEALQRLRIYTDAMACAPEALAVLTAAVARLGRAENALHEIAENVCDQDYYVDRGGETLELRDLTPEEVVQAMREADERFCQDYIALQEERDDLRSRYCCAQDSATEQE